MKTILAGNANSFLNMQIKNMKRKIHSIVNVLNPCSPAYSKLASVRLPNYKNNSITKHVVRSKKTNMYELE